VVHSVATTARVPAISQARVSPINPAPGRTAAAPELQPLKTTSISFQ
jgi:hypothetical protein